MISLLGPVTFTSESFVILQAMTRHSTIPVWNWENLIIGFFFGGGGGFNKCPKKQQEHKMNSTQLDSNRLLFTFLKQLLSFIIFLFQTGSFTLCNLEHKLNILHWLTFLLHWCFRQSLTYVHSMFDLCALSINNNCTDWPFSCTDVSCSPWPSCT